MKKVPGQLLLGFCVGTGSESEDSRTLEEHVNALEHCSALW